MPAGRSAVAQCPFCCNPRLEVETSNEGEIYGAWAIEGFVGFEDATIPFDPDNPQEWPYYGRIFNALEMTGFISGASQTRSYSSTGGWNNGDNDYLITETVCFVSPPVCEDTFYEITEAPYCLHGNTNAATVESITLTFTGGSVQFSLAQELFADPGDGESPTATGEYECSSVSLDSGEFQPTESAVYNCDLTTYLQTFGGNSRTRAKKNYRLEGAALQAYEVTITFSETTIDETHDYDDVTLIYEITTDAEGIAEWSDFIPLPPAGRKRCYKSYQIV